MALQFVDRIIQALGLPMADMDDPDVCVYSPRTIPMVYYPAGYASPESCTCISTTSPSISSTAPPQYYSFSFSFNPPWDPNWTVSEILREESRRICWSALNLIANYTAQSVAFHQSPLDLHLMEPSNVGVLGSLCRERSDADVRTVLYTLPRRSVRTYAATPHPGSIAEGFRVGPVLPQHAPVDQRHPAAGQHLDDGGARRFFHRRLDRDAHGPGRPRHAQV